MGTVAREALQRSGEYCCGLARRSEPELQVFDSLDEVFACRPDVLLDLTTQPGSYEISLAALSRGYHVVIGSSGWSDDQRAALRAAADEQATGAILVPNFSLGAMLMMRFAEEAARFFPEAEIVELHHAAKKDAPSGTARETAARIERVTGASPAIHSVRLTGLLAHHEVIFGRAGELLTIRHDSFARESFVAGMLAAVHAAVERRGLTIGLESILEPRA